MTVLRRTEDIDEYLMLVFDEIKICILQICSCVNNLLQDTFDNHAGLINANAVPSCSSSMLLRST